jgi:hypothetical protein
MYFRIVCRHSGEQAEGRPVQLRPGAGTAPSTRERNPRAAFISRILEVCRLSLPRVGSTHRGQSDRSAHRSRQDDLHRTPQGDHPSKGSGRPQNQRRDLARLRPYNVSRTRLCVAATGEGSRRTGTPMHPLPRSDDRLGAAPLLDEPIGNAVHSQSFGLTGRYSAALGRGSCPTSPESFCPILHTGHA